jgi:hypothetical protein
MKRFYSVLPILVLILASVYCGGGSGGGNDDSPQQLPAPVNIITNATPSIGISVSWDSVDGANYYYVYYSQNLSGPFVNPYYSGSTSITIPGLVAATNYYIVISAMGNEGEGEQSLPVMARTRSNLPSPATVTVDSRTATSITLSWSTVLGAEGYRIYERGNGHTNQKFGNDVISTSCTITGLDPEVIYICGVSSFDTTDESDHHELAGTTFSDKAGVSYKNLLSSQIYGIKIGGYFSASSVQVNYPTIYIKGPPGTHSSIEKQLVYNGSFLSYSKTCTFAANRKYTVIITGTDSSPVFTLRDDGVIIP